VKNDRSIFLSVLLVVGGLAVGTPTAHAAEDYIARAVSVSGKVLARSESVDGAIRMTFLKPGDKLYQGSIVNTGSNGAVKLLMTDRTILDLGPSSLFKLNDYQFDKAKMGDRKVDLSLDYGTVRASVNEKLTTRKGKFTIRTKAATMGVRGTEFVVNAPIPEKNAAGATIEPPKMSLTVMHGKVEVADANAAAGAPVVPVTPGLQFAKSGSGPGQVAQLGTQEVAKIKSDAFQKDMTFLQTISFDPTTAKEKSETSARENRAEASRSEGKDPKKEAKEPSSSGGNETIASIGAAVEAQAAEAPKPTVGDLKLPGTFTPDIPQQRPIDQLNGRLVNLRVRICPNGGC
jgi:hypothetical protein